MDGAVQRVDGSDEDLESEDNEDDEGGEGLVRGDRETLHSLAAIIIIIIVWAETLLSKSSHGPWCGAKPQSQEH